MANSLVWFRKGLRLHDNEALIAAAKGASKLYPVFVLDPWFADPAKISANRYGFLLESLTDLDSSLRKLGSRLFVLIGSPLEQLPKMMKEWEISRLAFEKDTEPYAVKRDKQILELAKDFGVNTLVTHGHTLYDPDVLTAKLAGKKSPDTYVAFQKLLSTLPPPTEPKPVPASLPSRELCSISEEQYRVPSLTDMGFDAAEATTPFKGGETLALERMRLHLQRKQWVAAFEKPNTAPNSLEPSTTVLSPYLKFGCLSCRSFYWGLKAVEKEFKSCSQPPVSLMGQLLWREFFYYQSYITPNFDRMIGNPRCKQISWDYNEAYIQRWRDAQTGFPWIDAAMTQLRREGWMHHLSRHAVACFLTRGDLYQSWEHGAKVFDQLLLDSDWALNNGNWMWLSASGYFYQYWRVYSPIAFPKKTDPNGDYIRKYLPQFKDFPSKFIYEPWKAPEAVLAKHGIKLGVNYPLPIVDHDEVCKRNIGRHSEAYKAQDGGAAGGRGEEEGGGGGGGGGGGAAAAGSSFSSSAARPAKGSSGVGATQVGSDPAAAASYWGMLEASSMAGTGSSLAVHAKPKSLSGLGAAAVAAGGLGAAILPVSAAALAGAAASAAAGGAGGSLSGKKTGRSKKEPESSAASAAAGGAGKGEDSDSEDGAGAATAATTAVKKARKA